MAPAGLRLFANLAVAEKPSRPALQAGSQPSVNPAGLRLFANLAVAEKPSRPALQAGSQPSANPAGLRLFANLAVAEKPSRPALQAGGQPSANPAAYGFSRTSRSRKSQAGPVSARPGGPGQHQQAEARHANGGRKPDANVRRWGMDNPDKPASPTRRPETCRRGPGARDSAYRFLSGRLGFGAASIRFLSSARADGGLPPPPPSFFGSFTPVCFSTHV